MWPFKRSVDTGREVRTSTDPAACPHSDSHSTIVIVCGSFRWCCPLCAAALRTLGATFDAVSDTPDCSHTIHLPPWLRSR